LGGTAKADEVLVKIKPKTKTINMLLFNNLFILLFLFSVIFYLQQANFF